MVDGFYTGNSRDCGYSFGVYYSVFKGNANTWSFGGEYLKLTNLTVRKVVFLLLNSRERLATISTLSATIPRLYTSTAVCRPPAVTKQ